MVLKPTAFVFMAMEVPCVNYILPLGLNGVHGQHVIPYVESFVLDGGSVSA